MFIAFEGLDGSGSSTQSKLLAERLESEGQSVVLTKEPTNDTPTGRLIRDVLQHKFEISPDGLQLMFCADRASHLSNEIEPALEDGKVVITDRYLFSTIAYGSLSIQDIDWLKSLNKHFRVPDITFLLQLDPKECINRIQGRGSEFELFEKTEKLEKIWEGYRDLAKEYPDVHILDASKTIEELSDKVWSIVSSLY